MRSPRACTCRPLKAAPFLLKAAGARSSSGTRRRPAARRRTLRAWKHTRASGADAMAAGLPWARGGRRGSRARCGCTSRAPAGNARPLLHATVCPNHPRGMFLHYADQRSA
eukprot:7468964-Alexandrium_andersonii.AAC.1